jgi:hypothetical protein
MLRKTRLFPSLSLLAISLLFAGCGAVSANPAPSPSPSPAPSPTPTSPAGPDSFQINLQPVVGRINLPNGQVTLDTVANDGAGKLNVPQIVTNPQESIILQFCSFPTNLNLTGCMNIVSFTQTGNPVSFDFPQKGTFTGLFQVVDSSGNQLETSLVQGPSAAPGVPYRSALLPAGSLTVPLGQTTGSSPGSGSMSVVGSTAHVILQGTAPNHTFSLAICNSVPCTAVPNSSFTTDAQGNISVDIVLTQTDGFISAFSFAVIDSDGAEFVSAFRVQ